MPIIPKHFTMSFDPVAHKDAVIEAGNARFTILTPRLVRIEYSASGVFEDRASQAVWYRNHPVPKLSVSSENGTLVIETDSLVLRYATGTRFTSATLSIALKGSETTWHYGDTDHKNLKGTYRTLDNVDGSIELDPGLLSRSGWAVLDDTRSLVFDQKCWIEPRKTSHHDNCDLYFFGYGTDYKTCIRDYLSLTGSVPLIPRWALGNWWSRYWKYSDTELLDLMNSFRENKIPLSVCVIDMDWHVVKNEYHNGWTGYTWNREYFSQPEEFLSRLKEEYGVKVSLNLNPRDGVHPHEEAYERMARAVGIDPATAQPVEFDIADPKFAKAYFEHLHHPIEQQGIDFWWMDWQQGTESKMPGLDPLYWVNHLHYYDLGRDTTTRPFVFSRWAGYGNHRYQIGFSGDTIVTWKSLAFQPYFSATAANVAYCWWSHDLGGHIGGVEEPELYARWVQSGVFSPITRLHSCDNEFAERRPWVHGREEGHAASEALRLRHRLIPYLYSMNEQSHREAVFMVRPMYHDHPETEEAYHCPQQHYFGTELVVAPFTSPQDSNTRYARQCFWLPDGGWRNFFTGEYLEGNRYHSIYGTIDDIPVFAREGGIVPMAQDAEWHVVNNPSALEIRFFAGADNSFSLYEDDGETTAFEKGEFCRTEICQKIENRKLLLTIDSPSGKVGILPPQRVWKLSVVGVVAPQSVSAVAGKKELPTSWTYDQATETLSIEIPETVIDRKIEVTCGFGENAVIATRDRREEKCYDALTRFRLPSGYKSFVNGWIRSGDIGNVQALEEFAGIMSQSQVQCLAEIATGCGAYLIDFVGPRRTLVAWNPGHRDQFRISEQAGWTFARRQELRPVALFETRALDQRKADPKAGFLPCHVHIEYFGATSFEYRANYDSHKVDY